jgi:putative SOS response-associated peptidase YedK
MCGRYASTRDPSKLVAEFDAVDATGDEAPAEDYNVAPTKPVLSVVQRHAERSIRVMRWGLVPKWAKDPSIGNRMINAKAETVAVKPAFRSAIKYHRCLLPADGWYEWQTEEGRKQPYFMTPSGGSSLALAGIWATWHAPDRETPLVSCAILTTDAVGQLRDVHDRMPLLLSPAAWQQWLDPERHDVRELLSGPSREIVADLELRPVSSQVNNVRNNGAELVERVPRQARTPTPETVSLDRELGFSE